MTVSRSCRGFPAAAGAGLAMLGLAAMSAPGHAVERDYLRLGYAGFLGPVQVIEASVGMRLPPGGEARGPYDMELDVAMSGPLAKLAPFRMTAQSNGRSDDGGVRPVRYSSMTRMYDDAQAMHLTYGGGGAVEIAADPPTIEARQAREQGLARGTMDPLSAVVALVKEVIRTGACGGRVAVFDGTRRFDLETSPAGTSTVTKIGMSLYQGPATECLVRPVFLEGFRETDVEAGIYPTSATIWIAQVVAGAPPVPVRVTGSSALGTLRLDLVEAWAMDGSTAAGAGATEGENCGAAAGC